MAEKMTVKGMVVSIIGIIIGIYLVPVIYTSITAANITDTTLAAVISLIPLVFVFALILNVVDSLM